MGRSAISFSTEFGQQIMAQVANGRTPENVARQLGRTPATIRHCLSELAETALEPLQNVPLRQRAAAFRNELLASLVSRRESRYVTQMTRELLQLYGIVAATYPGLARREIYRKVVMARTGCDDYEADALVRRAEQSFANWPSERDLTFADVVHYLAVSEYLTDEEQIATRIDMGRLVAGRIPPHL